MPVTRPTWWPVQRTHRYQPRNQRGRAHAIIAAAVPDPATPAATIHGHRPRHAPRHASNAIAPNDDHVRFRQSPVFSLYRSRVIESVASFVAFPWPQSRPASNAWGSGAGWRALSRTRFPITNRSIAVFTKHR